MRMKQPMGNYQPLSIANGFLELGYRDVVPVDPMKVQKLCYFAHGYYLGASKGTPLIRGQFQAWPFGPVNPAIYECFKNYRSSAITDYGKIFSPEQGGMIPAAAPEDDPLYLNVRDFVWTTYGRKPSMGLSDITHRVGGAWAQTWDSSSSRSAPIDNDLIRDEFAPLTS